MRIAAQAKQGFYPAAADAVKAWASHLKVGSPDKTTILEPCAGRGDAVKTLAESLGVPLSNVWACELDAGRGQQTRDNLEGATVLAPVDFNSIKCAVKSFSIAWVNPPFDDEMGGGGREETRFLTRATQLLVPGGVVGLVLPEKVFNNNYSLQRHVAAFYEQVMILAFPEHVRPFGEVIVTGVRRKEESYGTSTTTVRSMDTEFYWSVPEGHRPKFFEKGGPTEQELEGMLERSPLQRVFRGDKRGVTSTPILPLSNGHVSLLLASGQVDGVVHPEGEDPHVVRGVTKKVQYTASESSEETADGGTKHLEVRKEKIVLSVRAVDQLGNIRSFE